MYRVVNMGLAEAINRRTVSVYREGSIGAATRQKRWRLLAEVFPSISEMRVLDVGGDARSWTVAGVQPGHVTILNVGSVPDAPEPWMSAVEGDACDPPAGLGEFDLVFSNSVIEHVGGHWRRERFAATVRDLAPNYWVQTPNRYFPVEPHFLVPGLQLLPYAAQAAVITRWPVGNYAGLTQADIALERAMAIELLTKAQMQHYFPDAVLTPERLGPLVKSWIAIRTAA